MFFLSTLLAQAAPNSVFGTIDKPVGVDTYDAASGTGNGLILFASNIIRLGTIIAGIWVLFNFILAGYTYITSQGDSGAANKVREQITSSVLGLIIIVVAYTIVAIISLILFGDAGFILNPSIPSA